MNGKSQNIDKPFAVLEKCPIKTILNLDDTMQAISSQEHLNQTIDRTILDSTITIENKTKPKTEYLVKAIIRRKLIFKSRPKPIIANLAKQI